MAYTCTGKNICMCSVSCLWRVCGVFISLHIYLQSDATNSSHCTYIYSFLYAYSYRGTPQTSHTTHLYIRPFTHTGAERRRKQLTLRIHIFVSLQTQVQSDAAKSSRYTYISSSLYTCSYRGTPQTSHTTRLYIRLCTHIGAERRRNQLTLRRHILVS